MQNNTVKKERILSVKNLKISFRTMNGNVQAVRDVSFCLNKGETLAIVGESGSGKSVTSRAIMGILANNAIVQGGKIIYKGKDILKMSEDQLHQIRGDKVAMIFQDPMSSLNPIMRVGKQLTEAMILKNKVNRKNSRNDFNALIAKLIVYMNNAEAGKFGPELNPTNEENPNYQIENKTYVSNFDKFEYKHLELEGAYNLAYENATDSIIAIEDILFRIEKNAAKDAVQVVKEVISDCNNVNNYFLVRNDIELKLQIENLKVVLQNKELKKDPKNFVELLTKILEILKAATSLEKPNFFALGYYMTFIKNEIPTMSVADLNVELRKVLDDTFMLEFIARTSKALKYSHNESTENMKLVLPELASLKEYVSQDVIEKAVLNQMLSKIYPLVNNTIDKLDIYKSSLAYTFKSSMQDEIRRYFDGGVKNKQEELRYAKQTAKYDALVAKGKKVNWGIPPMDIWDLAQTKQNMVDLITELEDYFNEVINQEVDYNSNAVDIIDYLKEKATNVVTKVTKKVAKNKALKLLEEVGIPEPKRRYKQYPFEFSGGMRQRIVIAIALAANPDILICDEPTTALDVTIQSQILELINKLKVERNLSIIFITHDLGVVANMADYIAVMYAGKIVETGSSEEVFYSPAHPYTWALLSSMPDLDTDEKLEAIPGTPPNMIYPPKGDAFAERNKYAMQIDFEMQPPMFKITDTHYAATWLLHPNAPKVDPPKAVTDRIKRMKKEATCNE